jgi:hypothetical protein
MPKNGPPQMAQYADHESIALGGIDDEQGRKIEE